MAANREILAENQTALRVCLAAKDQPAMSAYQLAKALGCHQASLKHVLARLTAAGALREGSDSRRGRDVIVFRFNDDWAEAVWDVVRSKTVGCLRAGGRVILVSSAGIEAAAQLLREKRYLEQVAWIAEFEDSALAVAIGLREDADRAVVAAILPALRRLGIRPEAAIRLSVGRALDQPEVWAWTEEILEGPPAPPLPSAT